MLLEEEKNTAKKPSHCYKRCLERELLDKRKMLSDTKRTYKWLSNATADRVENLKSKTMFPSLRVSCMVHNRQTESGEKLARQP